MKQTAASSAIESARQNPLMRYGGWLLEPHVLLTTALALAIRLCASQRTLTCDEANGVLIAMSGSVSDMLWHLKTDGNTPLWYALTRLFCSIAGTSDVAVKLFAIALSTLQVPLTYLVCKTFLPRSTSSLIALLICLCPTLVRQGVLARPYCLASIFGLLSTWAFMRIVGGSGSKKWILLYGLFCAALVYSHYWGAFVCLGQAACVLLCLISRRIKRQACLDWLKGTAVALLLFAPWLPVLLTQSSVFEPWRPASASTALFGSGQLSLAALIVEGMPRVIFSSNFSDNLQQLVNLLLANTVIWGALLIPWTGRQQDEQNQRPELFDAPVWKTVTFAGMISGLLVATHLVVFRERYLLSFAVLFAVGYAALSQRLLRALPAVARYWLPFALWAIVCIPRLLPLFFIPETTCMRFVTEIKTFADPRKDLLVITVPALPPQFVFYLGKQFAMASYPDTDADGICRWDTMMSHLRDPSRVTALEQQMRATLSHGGKVWLVDSFRGSSSPELPDESTIERLSYFDLIAARTQEIRRWLAVNSGPVSSTDAAPGRDGIFYLTVFGKRPAP